MVLLPSKNPKSSYLSDEHELLASLEPPSSNPILRLELDRKMETPEAMSCGLVCMSVSWTRFIWSTASWTLLVCLLLARGRKGNSDSERESKELICSALPHADCLSLTALDLDGSLAFFNTSSAALDFGLVKFASPSGILYPNAANDIVSVVRAVGASSSSLTVAAKGRGHSVNGQAQALNGIVIEMSTLKGIKISPNGEPGWRQPFVDVAGGELWIDVLEATLKEGLAPRSWTDYLYLSIGGTLSNAGIGGQSFLYGPEISNVLQLEVVTGTGELVNCSPFEMSDLFFGVLGGLGQFGIITKARIVLEPAHEKVRWIRAMYSNFSTFLNDQELLISQPKGSSFDYIEGFVVVKSDNPNNGWNIVPFEANQINASMIPQDGGPIMYYLELVKKFNIEDSSSLDQTVDALLAPLHYIPTLIFSTDVSYPKFLNRLHDVELSLASHGLWDVPHPWLNIFIPRSSIEKFDSLVFKKMVKGDFSGPILVYALNKEKWDTRSSAVTPNENVFYIVAFLRDALPSSGPSLGNLIADNDRILEICKSEGLGCKRYLPEYHDQASWENHFGTQWREFVRRKRRFDPQAILAPGQNIFAKIHAQVAPTVE